MCRSAEQCAERVADRENLVREMIEVLEFVDDRFGFERDDYIFRLYGIRCGNHDYVIKS